VDCRKLDWSVLIFALVLGVIKAVVRLIFVILAMPFNLLTRGLFTIVINASMFWYPTPLPTGVQIEGFTGVLIGGISVTVVS